MRKSGQLFSLDFLLGIVLVITVVAGLLQVQEVNAYNVKEGQLSAELQRMARTAAQQLVQHPNLACVLKAQAGNQLIGGTTPKWSLTVRNCMEVTDTGKSGVSKQDLRIPAGVKCNILADGKSLNVCTDDPSGAKNVAAIERDIIVSGGGNPFKKSEYHKCLTGTNCPAAVRRSSLKVLIWK